MDEISQVKDRIDLTVFIHKETGFAVTKISGALWNVEECPFCTGHGCFRVNAEKKLWKCFQCADKSGGDVFTFVERLKGFSFSEALKYLAELYGISLPQLAATLHRQDNIQRIKTEALQILREWRPQALEKKIVLPSGAEVTLLHYLTGIRKHNEAALDQFEVVIAKSGLTEELVKRGYSKKDIEVAGLCNGAGHDYFADSMILIPQKIDHQLSHFSTKDPLKRFEYQSKKDHRHPRCLLMNMDVIDLFDELILVEGENDVISVADKGGYQNVIGLLGTPSEEQIQCLKDRCAKKTLVLCLDQDSAGKKFTNILIEKLKDFVKIKLIEFEGFKDIDELLCNSKSPHSDFKTLLETAVNAPDKVSNILVKGDSYFILKTRHKHVYEEQLTNFRMQIVHQLHMADEACIREIRLISAHRKSALRAFSPRELASAQEFTRAILSCGDYTFFGNTQELMQILMFEMDRFPGRRIHRLESVGYSQIFDFWIFGNGILKEDTFYPINEDGITWIENEGYKLLALNSNGCIPKPLLLSESEAKNLLAELIENLHLNLGGYEGWLMLGFLKACVYADEIFKEFGFFPGIYIHGRHQSGKNVLAGIALKVMGLNSSEIESLPAITTTVGPERKLAYYSNLLVWFDEYRNDGKSVRINGFLRNAYNRVSRNFGKKGSFGSISNPIRGILGISGEDRPEDPALRERFVYIHLSAIRRDDSYFEKIHKNSHLYSGIFSHWILEKTPGKSKAFIESIRVLSQKLIQEEKIDVRLAGNYAVAIAGLLTIREDEEFLNWSMGSTQKSRSENESIHTVNRFWDDIHHLQVKKLVDAEYLEADESTLYIWFAGTYNQWVEHRRKLGMDTPPSQSLLDTIKEESYFIEHNKPKRMGSKSVPRKCLILDRAKLPDSLVTVCSFLETKSVPNLNEIYHGLN